MFKENDKMVKGSIITLKLSSGEEVLGTLSSIDDNFLKLSKLRVVVNFGNTNDNTYGLAPYTVTLDDSKIISVNKNVILFYELTDPEYEKQYIKITSSIII